MTPSAAHVKSQVRLQDMKELRPEPVRIVFPTRQPSAKSRQVPAGLGPHQSGPLFARGPGGGGGLLFCLRKDDHYSLLRLPEVTGPPVNARSLQYIDRKTGCFISLLSFFPRCTHCRSSYIYTEDVFVKVLSSAVPVGGGGREISWPSRNRCEGISTPAPRVIE